jgi:aminopeptidase
MYQPDEAVLKAYADLLVRFALNSGKGVNPKEVVYCVVPDVAKPMYGALQTAILEAGAYPLMRFLASGFDKDFYTLASDDQLTFFPKQLIRERVRLIDHSVGILAEHDLHELETVDPKKMVLAAEAQKKYRVWLNDKEYSGKFTWTLGLYGTEAMAAEAGMTLEAYWQQIIEACYLDRPDPVKVWRQLMKKQDDIKRKLNALPIEKLHVQAQDTDLWVTLGEKRRFVGGSGRNIPSYEIFTSPDWRGTEGEIFFNQPLYRYGHLIEGVYLRFLNGKVVEAKAQKGEALLKAMLERPNADKVGEFSLTEGSMSRITHFMANTLYDENRGGTYGNMHLAIGMSYKDVYDGDPRTVDKKEWQRLGFNDSGEHTDIVSTTDRTVTATLKDGSTKVIYSSGAFTL